MTAPAQRRARAHRRRATTRNEPAPALPEPTGPIDKLVASWWAPSLLLLLLGGLIYAGALSNGFVLDDEVQITGNESIHSLSAIGTYFSGSSMDTGGAGLGGIYYKPLMTLSYAIIWAVFGPSTVAFHTLQLLLHVLVAILAFGVFQLFTGRRLALALSLIFLVHPINTECVVYAADLQDTLYMAFGLMALRLCAREGRFGGWQSVAIGGLLLTGMLSKETGLAFVLVCGMYVHLFKRNRLKRYAAAAGTALLVYLYLRFGVAHLSALKADTAGIARASLGTRLLTMPAVGWHYLATFLWPARLTVTQDWVVARPGLVDFWLPALGLASLAFAVAWYARAHRDAGFGFFAVWAVLGFGLHSQLAPLDGTVADRWFYFTEPAVLGMLGIVARDLGRRIGAPAFRSLVAARTLPFVLLIAALAARATPAAPTGATARHFMPTISCCSPIRSFSSTTTVWSWREPIGLPKPNPTFGAPRRRRRTGPSTGAISAQCRSGSAMVPGRRDRSSDRSRTGPTPWPMRTTPGFWPNRERSRRRVAS